MSQALTIELSDTEMNGTSSVAPPSQKLPTNNQVTGPPRPDPSDETTPPNSTPQVDLQTSDPKPTHQMDQTMDQDELGLGAKSKADKQSTGQPVETIEPIPRTIIDVTPPVSGGEHKQGVVTSLRKREADGSRMCSCGTVFAVTLGRCLGCARYYAPKERVSTGTNLAMPGRCTSDTPPESGDPLGSATEKIAGISL